MSFTLNQPVTAALPPGEEELFTMALDLIPDIKKITEEQFAKLKRLSSTLAEPIFPNST
jgi:hypothetical protein